jgi:hypothetical protein
MLVAGRTPSARSFTKRYPRKWMIGSYLDSPLVARWPFTRTKKVEEGRPSLRQKLKKKKTFWGRSVFDKR